MTRRTDPTTEYVTDAQLREAHDALILAWDREYARPDSIWYASVLARIDGKGGAV